MPAALSGYLAGVGVVTMLYWSIAPAALLVAWIGAFVAMCVVRAVVIQRFRRAAPRTRDEWLGWRLRSNVGTVVAASLWGATGWIFYGLGSEQQQATGLIIVVYTFTVAGIPVLSTQPRLYLAYASLCLLPLIVRIAAVGDVYSYQLAGELVLIISLTTVLANSYRQALQRAIDLKVQGDKLAAQLRVETLAAEAARREAEIANRAKTQFFTAASHDLRQPLHAMGLFAEALRQRVREPEVAQLVNSINESVDALEGLFSELLDITRIDSGVIEVHPQHFEVGDILRKLRLHFQPSAFEKGLSLRLRGGARAVFADPLLVERILRNLVSNAIRYTNDGSVLVGCRQRGDRVRLQVWDTGLGITPTEQARIFDEFYQVPNTPKVSPDQRKGLGLGLAIVKRLAGLMGTPLTLRSTPGRGTVFTLDLPAGRAPRPSALLSVPGKGPADPHAGRSPHRRGRGRTGSARRPRGAAGRLGRADRGVRQRRGDPRLGRAQRPGARQARSVDRRLPSGGGSERGRRDQGPACAFRPRHSGDPRHRQHDDRPREGGDRARLPPADQAGRAEQAARDDRVQAGGEAGWVSPRHAIAGTQASQARCEGLGPRPTTD